MVRWEKLLEGYWDRQLLYLLKYGFPIDFNYNNPLTSATDNHYSARCFQQEVAEYFKEEIRFGAIKGLFEVPPIHNLHVSPFLTRPKSETNKRRVIVDLNYPTAFAVNSNID